MDGYRRCHECRRDRLAPSRSPREVAVNPDPNPDYDATDEIEYFFSWLPWALRGTDWTGTPAYPPV
jgi:hypothetical protein